MRSNTSQRLRRVVGYLLAGRLDRLWYGAYVRLKRLDFGPVSADDLGMSGQPEADHESSGGPDLLRVLRSLGVPPGSRILDLGSGKGGALVTMSRFPFDVIAGVELSDRLVQVASANLRRMSVGNVRLICCDAAEFTDLDEFTHAYMFNPFPPPVLQKVIANVDASLQKAPRRFTLIYKYPGCPDEHISSRLLKKDLVFEFPLSHPFHVYVSG